MKPKNEPFSFQQLVRLCHTTHASLQQTAARTVDTLLVARNWFFGCYIVEFENGGARRSELYGKQLIDRLAHMLSRKGIKGVSPTNLRKFREFYLAFPKIQQTPSVKSSFL